MALIGRHEFDPAAGAVPAGYASLPYSSLESSAERLDATRAATGSIEKIGD